MTDGERELRAQAEDALAEALEGSLRLQTPLTSGIPPPPSIEETGSELPIPPFDPALDIDANVDQADDDGGGGGGSDDDDEDTGLVLGPDTCVGDETYGPTRGIERGETPPVEWISYTAPFSGHIWTDWCIRYFEGERGTDGSLDLDPDAESAYDPPESGVTTLLQDVGADTDRRMRIKLWVVVFQEAPYDIGAVSGSPTHWRNRRKAECTGRLLGYCLKVCYAYYTEVPPP